MTILDVLSIIVVLVFSFGMIILVHEIGHYLAARSLGVATAVFSIGFGKALWSRADLHGTKWQVAALPLGGYCRYAIDDNRPSLFERHRPAEGQVLLASLPLVQRSWIVVAGPLASIVFAFVLFLTAAILMQASGSEFQPGPGGFHFVSAVERASDQTFGIIYMTMNGLANTLLGSIDVCTMKGPMGMASLSSKALLLGPEIFLQVMAMFSLAMGLFNLLPVPGLDGGHLFGYAFEAVTGRPMGKWLHMVFFILAVASIVYIVLTAVLADLLC